MNLDRLSLAPLALLLIFTACARPAARRQVDVDSEPARVAFTQESYPYPFPFPSRNQASPILEAYPVLPNTEESPSQEFHPSPTAQISPAPSNTGIVITEPYNPTIATSVYEQPSPIPSDTGPQAFSWEGPGVIYSKTLTEEYQGPAAMIVSNLDGSQKSVVQNLSRNINPWWSDYSPETGTIVHISQGSLWIISPGKEHQNILTVADNRFIESPVITSDGTKIAYALVHGLQVQDAQLWMINTDGSENTLLIDNTELYITDPGPFRLVPVAWSLNKTRIYMTTTTDSSATPTGMYVAELAAGTVEKALTPQVTLWDVSFSPDRTMIAYQTFQWVPVPGFMPELGPPFTLNLTDLTTGTTRILLESDTVRYSDPIWSKEGNRIAYVVMEGESGSDIGLFVLDLDTNTSEMLVPGLENKSLMPWMWLSEERLSYTDRDNFRVGGPTTFMTLYTVRIDGADRYEIDTAKDITVLGVVDN